MAVPVCAVCFNMSIFCLFISIISVNCAENATSDTINTFAPVELNSTYNFTDIFTSTEPTTSPTWSSYRPTEQPPVAAEPLPVSGALSSAVTEAARRCPCDEVAAVCDVNCCCDRACSEEVALFTSCSVSAVRSGSQQLCSQDVAHYTLRTTIDGYSELQSSVQMETNYDIFCIQSQNRFDGLSHPSPPLPTDSNFDSLFSQFVSFMFGPEDRDGVQPADVQALSGYQFGDVLATAEPSGHKGMFYLPAAGVTADCVNKSPAAFLEDRSSRCSQRVVLDADCSSLQALRMDTYTNIQLFAGKNPDAAMDMLNSCLLVLPEVVPVDVASVTLQSTEGAQAELAVSGGASVLPELITPTLCANVVLKVVYVIKHNSAGEIENASVSVVLGFISEAGTPLQQEFQVMYIQDGGERGIHHSGNPGYVVGMPLMSGDRATDRSIVLKDTLSLLGSTEDQDCLWGRHQRSPVLFGLDYITGCTLRLEDITNCSLVSQLLLDVLRGPHYPHYVASFGNSPLENVLDWVPVKTNINPTEAQSCNIPLSLHLEVEWTKYGSLVNPQAQIVNIREVTETNRSSLERLSGGGSILPIRSSVAFIPVSATALPGYRATPSIDAKLPFDFFFPFV
ncbi:tectonic-1 isoform X2 [Fundulus heteroclitus]|uniref:tectonic-1 isoform X2 n=1 Tax=Fundulus heteroclitus TaxID=8078 RepID=UPI00165A1E72|nr:tectonic-1 isoform X2 [Fundulus heteroclitus]